MPLNYCHMRRVAQAAFDGGDMHAEGAEADAQINLDGSVDGLTADSAQQHVRFALICMQHSDAYRELQLEGAIIIPPTRPSSPPQQYVG